MEHKQGEGEGSLSCLLEPETAASGRESHSMQVAEEIKQINVSLPVGLITEGPSITITNSSPHHLPPPSPAPPTSFRPSACFPRSWRHKSCLEIRRRAKRNSSGGSIHHGPSSLLLFILPTPTPTHHPDLGARAQVMLGSRPVMHIYGR